MKRILNVLIPFLMFSNFLFSQETMTFEKESIILKPDSGKVNVVVIKVTLDTSIYWDESLSLKQNAIKTPYHCSPALMIISKDEKSNTVDTVVYIMYPTVFFEIKSKNKGTLNAIVIVNYQGDNFNFSNGGDDSYFIPLFDENMFSITETLDSTKNLYKFNEETLPGNQLLTIKYLINNKEILETHKIELFQNIKYIIYPENRECD